MKSKLTVVYYDLESNIAEERLSGNIMPDGNFRIQEIPLFAPNLALNDIVAREREDKMLFFDHLDMTYSFSLAISQLNLKK